MKQNWNKIWEKYLKEYLAAPPRAGYFIQHFFRKKIRTILEIACGSSRDSLYLAEEGYLVTASDYEDSLINYLQLKFRRPFISYIKADAFNLPFEDNSFDLVFHNGFFVLFNEDEKLIRSLNESARVAKKYVLIFVHNKMNTKNVKIFEEKSKQNPLYDIRFFAPEEIHEIVLKSGTAYDRLRWLKFGGFWDILYQNRLWRNRLPNPMLPVSKYIVPILYQLQTWGSTERIACIIELKK